MNEFIPASDDPRRIWTDIGGDLEASYDGRVYVDIRVKGDPTACIFISASALKQALKLIVKDEND